MDPGDGGDAPGVLRVSRQQSEFRRVPWRTLSPILTGFIVDVTGSFVVALSIGAIITLVGAAIFQFMMTTVIDEGELEKLRRRTGLTAQSFEPTKRRASPLNHQEALPPGPPSKGRGPLKSVYWCWNQRADTDLERSRRPLWFQHQNEWFQGPLPLAEIQEGRASWWGPG